MDYSWLLEPSKDRFEADPFGYANMSWSRWQKIKEAAGFEADYITQPTNLQLNTPILWLSQAQAITEAAVLILRGSPALPSLPPNTSGLLDGQFRAVGLMLVGYSLEVCLKGMLILEVGSEKYQREPKKYQKHNLVELTNFIPDLNEKERAILQLLSTFVRWAGRYPCPKMDEHYSHEHIFEVSEAHKIILQDVILLAKKIMEHTRIILLKETLPEIS